MSKKTSPIQLISPRNWSLTMRAKLITAFVLVALVPLVILAVLNGRNAQAALIEDANQALFAVASQTAASMDTFIETNLKGIETEAQLPVLVDYLALHHDDREGSDAEEGVLALLRAISNKDPFISSYAVLNADGKVVIDTLMTDMGNDKSDREYFLAHKENSAASSAYVTPVLFHPDTGEAYLYFSSPVISDMQEFLGVLRVRFNASVLQNLIEDKNDLAGEGSFGVLFDENHLHLAHGTAPKVNFIPIIELSAESVNQLRAVNRLPHLSADELFIMQLDDLEEHLSNPETQRFFEAEDVATGELINQVAIARLETQPWLVTFFQPQEIFLAPVEAQTRTTLLVAAFIAAGAILSAFMVGQALGRPILRLTSTVTNFTEGNLDARTSIDSNDEIGILALSFNKLAEQVGSLLRGLEDRTAELEVEVVERQRAEKAARASEEQFRGVLATAPNAIVISGNEGRILLVNEQVEKVFGYSRDELIGQPVEILLPENLEETHSKHRGRYLDNPYTRAMGYGLDLKGRRKDGSAFPVDISLSPLETSDGTLVTSIIRDITERKEFEETLRESEERYRSTSELTSDYIYSVTFRDDGSNELDWATEAFTPLTGYSPVELEQRGGWPSIVHEEDVKKYQQQRDKLLRSGGFDVVIYRIITKEGEIRWLEDHRSASYDNKTGRVSRMLGAAKDITESVTSEQALQQAKEAAEAANRAKSAFLASMSHELRTPLNAILGFTQLMNRDQSLNSKQREQIDIISRSGEHLLALINDVLEMSKIEAGRMALDETSFDLHNLLDDLVDMLTLRATNKGIEIRSEMAPGVPKHIHADDGKLRQVLINLLSNAVKFTEQGEVVLRVGCPLQGSDEQLRFEVQDSGMGIPPGKLDSIFDAFVQVVPGNQATEGTGLGLAISQQFIRLMGGEISVSSDLNVGSEFSFEIPIKPASAGDVAVGSPERRVVGMESEHPGYRILIAEDHQESRQLLVELIQPFGFEIREAQNGLEAIEQWQNWHPHLIWMDMQMPILDGYEAIRQIKNSPEGDNTVIIAVTASAFEEDRENIFSEGVDDFVRKPFQEGLIYSKLADHLDVEFLYEEFVTDSVFEQTVSLEDVLASEILQQIPKNLLVDLQQAAVQADMIKVEALIDEIHTHNPDVAVVFDEYAKDFQYNKISQVLQAVGDVQ
ncbi:MAG: PAS domain S-box protein [Anaerolineales bacterium]|nr:PAS domain S-box protein [Chloroflexota bacterium]MBL6981074.1 PAS domain S-box protein [Anaerolineales bacterium]